MPILHKYFYKKRACGIDIVSPSKREISKIREALEFIEKNQPPAFRKTRKFKAILVYPKRGYENNIFSEERIWICKPQTVRESSVPYLASLLIHEAQHLLQHDRGMRDSGARAEGEAYKVQRDFLLSFGNEREISWLDSLYKNKWWVRKTSDGKATLFTRSYRPFKKLVDSYLSKKLEIIPLRDR